MLHTDAQMIVAFATSRERVSSCFSGAELRIVNTEKGLGKAFTINTDDLCSNVWGPVLLRYDVEVFVCSGIDRFAEGALLGNGIRIISDVYGSIPDVYRALNDRHFASS